MSVSNSELMRRCGWELQNLVPNQPERPAKLCVNGYAGFHTYSVTVIAETPKRYRVRADQAPVRLAGRARWLQIGETVLVPKTSVRFLDRSSSER